MIHSGLELLADCWCKFLTAGINLPSLGALMPSARQTKREPAQTGSNSARHKFTQQVVSFSKSSPLL